ncbi:winged helix-turn-helix domain-containing protein [Ruania halotolerans]|uniref:winged helix-turn-helix domain-containing protein n=1 Tax=Ruania halotolerans TaxID=2897773 RepID=UPI001E32BA10|nr:crosslink repair DNA glycosylase YcaQ family protein [Ruania halotolerans]UFU07592.1 winged helix DNA-binding domain-containing protein [Ruania halotolerans]
MPRTFTLGQARRIAVAAQLLDRSTPRPQRPTMAHLQRTIDRLGVVQIDSVNVLARAHLLPLQARLGSYDPALLDRATRGTPARPRRLVEYWAHEASYISPETYQALRWRMDSPRMRRLDERLWREHPETMDAVLEIIASHGPLTAAQVHERLGHRSGPRVAWGWNWTIAKESLESHFARGRVMSAHRTAQFERAYDLPERVLPRSVLSEVPDRTTAIRQLVSLAARAHGIGTARCLADYFRVPVAQAQEAIAHLTAAGELEEVTVRGWDRALVLHTGARRPRSTRARALLAPFDPLVFERRRLLELFGMHYRIGIYTPAAQRTYGYYVLPFLLGQDLVARTDVKADRRASALVVRTAFSEPDAPAETARELAAELRELAEWLDLTDVRPANDIRGDLAGALTRELAAD